MQSAILSPLLAPVAAGAWAASPDSALDEPTQWEGFSRPAASQPGCWESHLAITGMHCAACSLAVEATLAALPGVSGVEVNGPAALAKVVWLPDRTRPSDWLARSQSPSRR